VVNVRKARLTDIALLSTYDQEVNLTPWTKNEYMQSYNNSDHNIYLLMQQNIILACVVWSKVLDEAEILQFWVVKKQQRQGRATFLISYLLQELKTKYHSKNIFLEVRENNTQALALYQKLGFVKVGLRPNYYKVDSWYYDAVIMAKTL
jgi:ribosomal-protein-alanine N-acetyltransferase